MFKKTAAVLILFLASLFAHAQGGHVPTTGSNNVWTGTNTFNGGIFLPVLRSCTNPQVMAGFDTSFNPICVTVSGGGGAVNNVNGATGNVVLSNQDGNLQIVLSGSNGVHINCSGCGGSGGSPVGGQGAIQFENSSGGFAGAVITGMVFSNGTAGPRQATADSDFQLPIVITCSGTGITCPKTGDSWAFSLTGGAGTGAVASAPYGQLGWYAATGTTIQGGNGIYAVNPAWNAAQMTGLFSRFSGSVITGWSISSNVVTMIAPNGFIAGDGADLVFFNHGSFFDNNHITVLSTGLSNTQFEFNFTHADTSFTADTGIATINVPQQPLILQGAVIMPPGKIDNPTTQIVNIPVIGPEAQIIDTRKGYWFQQASAYGVNCDAQQLTVTLTAGSNLVNVGSSFSSTTQPIGMTMVVGQQIGYAGTGTQNTWAPIVTGYPFPNLTLSSNSPITGTFGVIFGTNNQAAFQRAIDAVGGYIPLWLPQCSMLTDTVRYKGTSLLGQQMQYTNLYGFPGHDILQQQDGLPLIAWSIDATAGVTTFTVPSYSAHSILAASDYHIPAGQTALGGDSVLLENFPTATFFNGQTINIATHPTPTTFTVNSVFGQSTSSGTDHGLAAPTSNVSVNAVRVEHMTFNVNEQIDPSYTWNQYDQNATLTVEPPLYRPIHEFSVPANNPFGSGWGTGQVNGVATITQNSAVICAPNAGRIPVVGTTIAFPYQTGGMFYTTVSSTAGSCAGGFTARTMAAAFPNTSSYTATQAEWFTYTTPQTLSVAMPGTITLPYTITVALPFPPSAGQEWNVAPHGHLIIGSGTSSQEWDYMGVNFGGTAGGTAQFVLRNGPTTVNGGSGFGISSIVFPLNPCQAMYHNPYPVVPTVNGGDATPVNSTFYAGNCAGNAGIALPMADAKAWIPFSGSGFSLARFNNVSGNAYGTNGSGNSDANGSAFMYQQGNYTGYGSTWDNLVIVGLWGGFLQGPTAVNEFGVRTVGPTSTGQSLLNCTIRAGYGIALVEMQQSSLDRCDTYSTAVSQYDGQVVGASLGIMLGTTLAETDGRGVDGMFQFTVKDYNNEPENGSHEEFMPSVISDCFNCTWLGNIFEGGYNVFGGGQQRFFGTQMAVPIFNYGTNNYFEGMYALNRGYNDSNVYNGTSSFYDWGSFTTCSTQTGQFGPLQGCGPGAMQSYNGRDLWSLVNGDPNNPTFNMLGGLIPPVELSSGTLPIVFDSSEKYFGQHAECSVGTGLECVQNSFDGIGAGLYIGTFQRIPPAKVMFKMNVKAKNSGTFTFRLLVSAQNTGLATCTPNFSLTNATFTVTSANWTVITLPVDYSAYASCSLGLQEDSGSSPNVLEIGAFAVVPFPGQMYGPLSTPTSGAACPVAGEFSFDTTHLWVCAPSSGATFGTGNWKSSPLT